MQWSAPSFSNAHRMKYYGLCSCDRSQRRKISRSTRASPVLAPVLLCYASGHGPVLHLLAFRETPILSGLRARSAIKFPVNFLFFTGRRRTTSEHASCGCVFANWAAKSIDLSPLDAKKARAFTRAGGCRLTIRATSFAFLPKRTQRANPERFERLTFDL